MAGRTIFDIDRVNDARERARELIGPPRWPRHGWSVRKVKTAKLLAAFAPLRLREGIVLRAYQWTGGGNGRGVVFAVPKRARFPKPGRWPAEARDEGRPPRPPEALDDVMSAVEGDGTPWSYLAASVLARELGDFGASWHGLDWSLHTVLGGSPFDGARCGIDAERGAELVRSRDGWRWNEPEPGEWRPAVETTERGAVVTFRTFCALESLAVFRHVDTFEAGSYRFASERTEIASAPGGYLV